MLLLALSCLQGRPMRAAAEELLALGADGLQLTPGCAPTPAFAAWVRWRGVPVRTHDGFSWLASRREVWPEGRPVDADSVHPPVAREPFAAWLERAVDAGVPVEVMYPGFLLGRDTEVAAALDAGLPLAVDVSHLHLQRAAGVLSDRTLRRLLAYPAIVEVHVSADDGKADRHWVPTADSYGLGWARERAAQGVPIVCESYLHRVDTGRRRALIDTMRTAVGA